MILSLEYKKVKRTGFFSVYIGGGLLAAIVPILNMMVRGEIYSGIDSSSIQILLDANWQMMAMLNVLLLVIGACVMYHTEYTDNAIEKMCTLPINESKLFFGKFLLTIIMCAVILILEGAAVGFCSWYWFEQPANLIVLILKNFSYFLLLMIPTALISLIIASGFKNMWLTLGIGVICVFTATMIPTNSFVLSLFPFSMPFQVIAGTAAHTIVKFIIAAVVEIIVLSIAQVLLQHVRRSLV